LSAAALIDYLVRENLVAPEKAQSARKKTGASHLSLIQDFVSEGVLDEAVLLKSFSENFSIPTIKLSTIHAAAIRLMPVENWLKFRCLPYLLEPDQTLRVAIADPTDLSGLEELRQRIKNTVVPSLTTFSVLETALKMIGDPNRAIAPSAAAASPAAKAVVPEISRANIPGLKPTASPVFNSKIKIFSHQESVVTILNEILLHGAALGASDIHVEPEPEHIRVRIRLEGALFDAYRVPLELKDPLIQRTKVLASLDIAERRVPQDGRIKIKTSTTEVSFRVNVMPSLHGENIVFRILRQDNLQFDLAKMGFDPKQQAIFKRGIDSPYGMILVTGPTGSGKTTTLYSALAALNHSTVKIATLEDPVEYNLPGITQVQINKDTGLDFAEVLKSLLRQDPDVILVGEVRDQETAKVAVQAALTGHTVLSSLHTNDAPSAIIRLLNMGVDPFAVVESVRTVVAQRLMRKICPQCVTSVRVTEEQLRLLGGDRALIDGMDLKRGLGCAHCLGGGYRGRAAIFEVLELSDSLKEMFLKGENLISVRRRAIGDGMMTLRQSALKMVASGASTLEEAISVTLEQ
jgi:type IV pilus assembly protein PilB